MEFLKERWLKLSWVAEQLWGENNASNRSLLSRKIKGEKWKFSHEELAKLEEIRKELQIKVSNKT